MQAEALSCACQGAPPVRGLQPQRRMVRVPVQAPSWTRRPPAWRAHPRGPAPGSEPAAWAAAAWLCILQSVLCCQPHRVSRRSETRICLTVAFEHRAYGRATSKSSASACFTHSSLTEHPAGQTPGREPSRRGAPAAHLHIELLDATGARDTGPCLDLQRPGCRSFRARIGHVRLIRLTAAHHRRRLLFLSRFEATLWHLSCKL